MINDSTDNDFVIIDLPVRFTNSEMKRLNVAIAKAAKQNPGTNVALPDEDLLAALEEASRFVGLYREREKTFKGVLFGDPSWFILLDLFIAEHSGKRVGVSSACLASGAPSTSALRYLVSLERLGLVIRNASANDQRVRYVRLTELAESGMRKLLATPSR